MSGAVAHNEIHVKVRPSKVFEVLADPQSYATWVVGSKEVRGADSTWPAKGTRFHHTVGIGPLNVKDHTSVEEVDPPRRLVLRTKVRPFAVARVSLELRPERGGTRVTMEEYAIGGPASKIYGFCADLLMKGRNAEALRRLKALAETG